MGSSLIETPKRHLLARKHVIWRIDRQNRSTSVGWARAEEYSKLEYGQRYGRPVEYIRTLLNAAKFGLSGLKIWLAQELDLIS